MKKMISYGVRNYELPMFEQLGKEYGYEFEYRAPYLTNENHEDAYGYEMVMVRGNCFLNRDSIKDLAEHGCKYLLTRTAGYNHLDIAACKEFGIKSAFVPGYSPNAIAELAVSLAMAMLRNIIYTVDRTKNQNFVVSDTMFSREIRSCTVGILGCGRIGRTAAQLFKGLGARVIGYDLYPTEEGKKYIEYVDLDTFAKEADVISIHLNYIKGSNDNLINKEFIDKMKEHAIIIDTGRGEVVDFDAVLDAVEAGKLDGFATDVVKNETKLFFKDRSGLELEDPVHQRMLKLYPKVVITPHIGSATNLALKDMIEVTLKNMDEILATGTCKNTLTEK